MAVVRNRSARLNRDKEQTAADKLERRRRRWRLERAVASVHVLLEVADARAPRTTREPALTHGGFARVPRVIVLTHRDLADQTATRKWMSALGPSAVAVDARQGGGCPALLAAVRALRPEGAVRAMVAGLPNLGKSSLVNRLVGRAAAATGDRPGVTRGEQWVRGSSWLLIWDEPGVIPASSEDWRLAALGVLPEGSFDPEPIARQLLHVPAVATALSPWLAQAGAKDPLDALAIGFGALGPGGTPDVDRAARQVLIRFRSGRLGRATLDDLPDDREAGKK